MSPPVCIFIHVLITEFKFSQYLPLLFKRYAGIYLEFLVDVHPKFQGLLIRWGSGGRPPFWGPGAMPRLGSRWGRRAEIDFKHFFMCLASPWLFFYNNKLAFSPSETKKAMLKIYKMLLSHSENTGIGDILRRKCGWWSFAILSSPNYN